MRRIPIPRRIPLMTCGTQLMFGFDVQANQKSPIGRMRAPAIIGGNRSSGITLPSSFSFRAKRVFVVMVMATIIR